MASRRYLKKEIDYLVGEIIGDAQLCLYFNDPKKREQIIAVMEEAVALRNDLFARIRPEEKNNPRLVRKHYAALRNDLMVRVDGLFEKLSGICKA
jgi:hypothetical protein